VRQLDLLEVVDADRMAVPVAGEDDLDEVGDDAQLDQLARPVDLVQGQRLERALSGLPPGM
jgi:hypothetical protein